MYDTINSFGSKKPDKTHFCCDILLKCGVISPPTECPFLNPLRIFIQYNSINNSKSCITFDASSLLSGLCGGILGNANLINAIEGSCSSSDTIINTLKSQKTIRKFGWLCYDSENNSENCKLLELENIKFKDNITVSSTQEAFTSCANDEYSLMCFKDNKIWICTGEISSTINI